MNPIIRHYLFFLAIIIFNQGCSTSPEKISTGLRVYKETDSSRLFDTTAGTQAVHFYRPVKIDLFYPSSVSDSLKQLNFGEILDMYEQRMNYSTSKDSCRKTSLSIANTFAEYLGVSDPQKLIAFETGIYSDLPLPSEKFPLIIYAAGMNGSSWENPLLFDSLVSAGYIVAAVSSVGKFPGYMTAAEDLDEQVRDIMYAKKKLKSLPFIDGSKIGLMSWSMGGSAITKAAMLSNDFKCLLSFDGTETHYYGNDTTWDREFDRIKQIPPFIPERVSIPYLYLSSDRPDTKDSVYLFSSHIASEDNFYLKLKGAVHESFSSIIQIAKFAEPTATKISGNHDAIVKNLSVHFFDQYLKKKNGFSLKDKISEMIKINPGLFSNSPPRTVKVLHEK
jgi:hypothetical protein